MLKPAAALCACALFSLSCENCRAALTILYDGTVQSATPNNFVPRWLAFASLGGSQTYQASSNSTNFTTIADNAIQGGYSNYFGSTLVNSLFPALDRMNGYRLSFDVEIVSESHLSNERAGFSVIAISRDAASGVKSGVEIGFHANRIFSQNDSPVFGSPAAESANFNSVGVGVVSYELTVQGSAYSLRGAGQSIIAGALKDYSAFSGSPDVYELPSFIFLGDNTTSAGANINLRYASIETLTARPFNMFENLLNPCGTWKFHGFVEIDSYVREDKSGSVFGEVSVGGYDSMHYWGCD